MSGGEITPEHLKSVPLPLPPKDGDKEQRGLVFVIAGSVSVPGAALLAATATLRAGAGKLQVGTCRSFATQLGLALPEALVIGLPETTAGEIHPEAAALLTERITRCDAVLVGPGILDEDGCSHLLDNILDCEPGTAIVLDAGALAGLGTKAALLARHKGRVVITPHAGEMANLLGVGKDDIIREPARIAAKAASQFQCVVALKGARTHIADADEAGWIYQDGNPGLATSGSGDTLAGIIAGLLARGVGPVEATQWGVYLHGEAGNRLARSRGPLGFLARELLDEIPAIMASF
jgi:ADP-dependent NAD(P)H-hydrate dehydratase